jgi:hypothetical protein
LFIHIILKVIKPEADLQRQRFEMLHVLRELIDWLIDWLTSRKQCFYIYSRREQANKQYIFVMFVGKEVPLGWLYLVCSRKQEYKLKTDHSKQTGHWSSLGAVESCIHMQGVRHSP